MTINLLAIVDKFYAFTVSIRLKSVTNIEKITKSMKMVSAAKYQIADRELKPARVFGLGAQGKCIDYCIKG
jgi:hypothetical protein